jgi:hypothetical protein
MERKSEDYGLDDAEGAAEVVPVTELPTTSITCSGADVSSSITLNK